MNMPITITHKIKI